MFVRSSQAVRSTLSFAWNAQAFTASDVMVATKLTRSTVIGACDELVQRGWLRELGDARRAGDYRKGRPARRYALNDDAALVIGVDAGVGEMSATVADLRGREMARAVGGGTAAGPDAENGYEASASARAELAREVVRAALDSPAVDASRVLAITVGVPAPVDARGASPTDDSGFWARMNPDLTHVFADAAPLVTVENDANLAAIAETTAADGRGRDVDSFIWLLVGEGLGSGLMIDRRLVRGRRGAAGELRFLVHVDGVGSAEGLPVLARQWAAEAVTAPAITRTRGALARLAPGTITEYDVAAAAAAGDLDATDIVDRLSARLARICIVLGDLLDVDRVVIGGSMVQALPAVTDRAAQLLALSGDPTAPELVASALGPGAIRIGAVEQALALVRERALEFDIR